MDRPKWYVIVMYWDTTEVKVFDRKRDAVKHKQDNKDIFVCMIRGRLVDGYLP